MPSGLRQPLPVYPASVSSSLWTSRYPGNQRMCCTGLNLRNDIAPVFADTSYRRSVMGGFTCSVVGMPDVGEIVLGAAFP